MKLLLTAQGVSHKDRNILTHELEKQIPSLVRRLGTTLPVEPILRAKLSVTGSADFPTYILTLSVRLPDHTAVVQKSDSDVRAVVGLAVTSLKKETRRVKARIRKDHLTKRRHGQREGFASFTQRVPEAVASATPPADNPIFDRLRPLLGPVYNYARELIRSAVLAGEIPSNYLSPNDLVDGAVVALAEDAASALRDPSRLEAMLYAHIEEAVASEAAQHQPNHQAMLSLDDSVPDDVNAGVGDPEKDEAEYYQPFQALRMEDVLIDEHAQDPEHHLSDLEEHKVILKFLAHHPAKARGAFFLNRMEGFEPFEIAMIQDRDEQAVRADIDTCIHTLQEGWNRLIAGELAPAKARA
jgi:DNA-directed RNA polymerase specialized sigma24 family protein/ribosome-associated translation inhibitor RaiA